MYDTRTCEIYSCVLLYYCRTEWFCLGLCVHSQPTVTINKLKRLFLDEKLWWSRAGYWPLTRTGSAAERLVACPSGTPERRAGWCAQTWKHGEEPSKFSNNLSNDFFSFWGASIMTFILKGFRNQDQNNISSPAPGWSWEVTLESNTAILLSLLLLQSNTDGCCTHLNLRWRLTDTPVGGAVVAVVGQEVVVELPEDVQRDSAVRRRHVVVGLAEHGVKAVQSQVLAEELVRHAVDVQQTLQFLQARNTHKIMHHTENTFWAICSVKPSVPWWRWGPRSQSGWWPAPETCRGQPRPSGWWAGSDRWSDLGAESGHQLKRQKQRCDTGNKGGATDGRLPGRGAASGEYHSGWRWARECWPLDSYTRFVNVCPAGGWGVQSDTDRERRLIYDSFFNKGGKNNFMHFNSSFFVGFFP